MPNGLMLLSEFWRYRKELVLPTLLVPILMAGWSLSAAPSYTATALLQLDSDRARSPLLQELDKPGNAETLQKLIRGDELLRDTTRDAGMRINPQRITVRVINDSLLEIGYSSPQELGIEPLVDALAYNFIYEILAPERLRIEQRVAATGQQLTKVRQQLRNPTPDITDIERLRMEETALATTYTQLMNDLSSVNAAFDRGSPNALIWFVQPATLQAHSTPWARAWQAAGCGLIIGLGLGLLFVAWQQVRPRGVRTGAELARLAQLPVAGELPDMGAIQINEGKAQVALGQTVLDPTDFTETVRLHRALMRNLHGALVLTSAAGGEGTSMLATLLALKSAASGKRTLLVDLNLKNGWVTDTFGLAPQPWELDKMKSSAAKGAKRASGGTVPKSAIAEAAGAHKLDILPLPADKGTLEVLAQGGGAAALFDGLSSTYEHIVVDTTPMVAHNRQNADAILLASAANRAALIVLMRRTSPMLIKAAADQLVASGANMAGVIANNLFAPSPRVLLLDMAKKLGRLAPGLSSWLRAKVIQSGVE